MSYNIFYTEVDKNLQTELKARGRAGMLDRSQKSLDFMLSKIANVQITAFEGSGSQSPKVFTLGGAEVRKERFTPDSFLSETSYEEQLIDYYKSEEDPRFLEASSINSNVQVGRAYAISKTLNDDSRRVAPFISDVSINIGDHSFGLLNKATIQITIPNVERDLDVMEDIFFRPGRFARIDIVHPESAIIAKDDLDRGILLTTGSIPNDERLKKLYPGLVTEKLDELKKQARKMNEFRFEGLITTFNFSYDADGTVNATLNLTGTSNVYTDVTMFTDSDTTKEKSEKPRGNVNPDGSQYIIDTKSEETGSNYTSQFYEQLYDKVDQTIAESILLDAADQDLIDISDVINSQVEGSSAELLFSLDIDTTEKLPNSVLTKLFFNNSQQNTATSTDNWVLKGEAYKHIPPPPADENSEIQVTSITPTSNLEFLSSVTDYRYITLGGLISFLNETILVAKAKEAAVIPLILCDDQVCSSNYHNFLVSANPEEILLLPADPSSTTDLNSYGNLTWYQDIIQRGNDTTKQWLGVYSTESDSNGIERTLIYPSRILINLSTIDEIVTELSREGRESYRIKHFLDNISAKIRYNTGGAIDMKLVSHPTLQSQLLFTDVKNIQPIVDSTKEEKVVEPFSVPMFANHPDGTICHSFNFNASLPENAKNLAYVLNSSDEISESDIAPFLNFMYTAGSRDVSKINNFLEKYEQKHLKNIEALVSAKFNYGEDPTSEEAVTQLRKALYEYMKFPKKKILDSQQVTAPVFPFDVDFTIDGINGLRYGDVLTFKALPERYKVNTVFSIIGITHNVTTNGFWTSNVKCIMRPNIK